MEYFLIFVGLCLIAGALVFIGNAIDGRFNKHDPEDDDIVISESAKTMLQNIFKSDPKEPHQP